VGFEIRRRWHLQAGLLEGREIGLQRPNDPLGQFALNREKIGQLPVETLSPNVRIGLCVDQLRVHPYPVASTAHRPFEDMGDAERFADLAQVPRP
jgi:hypothetical protein